MTLIPNLQRFGIEFRPHLLQVVSARTLGERLTGGHWSISVQDSPNPNHSGRAAPDRLRAFMESNFGTYLTIAVVILGVLAAISCLFLDCV